MESNKDILERIYDLIRENERKGLKPIRIIISRDMYDELNGQAMRYMEFHFKEICGIPVEVRETVPFDEPILETRIER